MMEMASEFAHIIFKVTSIFSIISAGRDDVLSLGSPFKERYTWKGKVEAMELKFTNTQKDLFSLQEEVKDSNSLSEAMKVHGFPSTLTTCVSELEGSLQDTKKRYKDDSNYIEEKAFQVEGY